MNEYKMTEGVLYAVKNSQIVSRKYKLGYVGTEEVLYGLLCLPRCEACKCLAEYGVNKDNYFDQLKNSFRYDDKTGGFTPKAKAVINKDAEAIADAAKARYISTEHLLLAILNKKDCVAMSLLRRMNVNTVGLVSLLEKKIYAWREKEETQDEAEEKLKGMKQ